MTEARKINSTKCNGNVQRPINSVKASGDAGGKPQGKHKNKNKIPKSLRYDLENALVGLCDIWFEEIKPYLVSNNVKVHVHDSEIGGGDREAPAPECSHLDPGRAHRPQPRNVGCAGCCSTPQTASRARFHRPPSHPVSSSPQSRLTESTCLNYKNEPKKPHRRKRQTVSQSPPRTLVPRLCRTYSIPPYNTPEQMFVNNNNNGVQLKKQSYPKIIRVKTKDASTQTETKLKKRKQVITKPNEGNQGWSRPPSVKKYPIKDTVKTDCKKIQRKAFSPQFNRCQAKTTFFPSKITKHNPDSGLFQDDLIDIISDKNDKRLKVLYKSAVQEEYPSIMNLYSPSTNIVTHKKTYKPPPWK